MTTVRRMTVPEATTMEAMFYRTKGPVVVVPGCWVQVNINVKKKGVQINFDFRQMCRKMTAKITFKKAIYATMIVDGKM